MLCCLAPLIERRYDASRGDGVLGAVLEAAAGEAAEEEGLAAGKAPGAESEDDLKSVDEAARAAPGPSEADEAAET